MWKGMAGGLKVAGVLALTLMLGGCILVDMAQFNRARSAATLHAEGALPVELPFRQVSNLMVVPVRVNGGPTLDFVLDTGAPVSVLLDSPETAALKLDLSDARKLGNGPTSPIGAFRYGFGLDFGGVRIDGLPMVAVPIDTMPCRDRLDSLNIRGIIGADLFSRLIVEVDFDRGILRLHDPAAWRFDGRGTVLPLTFNDGHIFTDARIVPSDGPAYPVMINIDTGKNTALSLRVGSRPDIVMPAEGRDLDTCLINGRETMREGAPVGVALGDVMAADVTPQYSARKLLSGDHHGTIGMRLLSRYDLVIDYPGKRIILMERGPAAAAAKGT